MVDTNKVEYAEIIDQHDETESVKVGLQSHNIGMSAGDAIQTNVVIIIILPIVGSLTSTGVESKDDSQMLHSHHGYDEEPLPPPIPPKNYSLD